MLWMVRLMNGQGEVFEDYIGGSLLEITEVMLVGRDRSNITEVKISGSNINEIADNAFALLPNVEKIILSDNQLGSATASIRNHAFGGLPELRYLDLSGNSDIVSLTAETWIKLLKPILTHLVVDRTQMEDADFLGRILNLYSRLLHLNAAENNNYAITSYLIAHSESSPPFQRLILDNNKLEITDDSLSRLTNLSHLSLNNVDMQPNKDQFMATLIENLPTSIKRLDLDHNGITSLDLSLQNDLNQLSHLSLYQNSFSAPPSFSSAIYNNLVYLDLSEPTNSQASYNFQGSFKNLQVLKITGFLKTALTDEKLTKLLQKVESNLQHLNLNGNWEILLFPDLSRFENLTRLELRSLSLIEITEEDFKHLRMLQFLDVSDNILITIADMSSHLTSLSTLIVFPQLWGLDCDCRLAWLKGASFNIPDPPTAQAYQCTSPASLQSKKWVDITYAMIMSASNCILGT